MTDANETAWTVEGGKTIPNAVNESSEGTGFQPGDGVVEEASEPQEVSSADRTPEEEFLAQMLAASGATNLKEAGLYDPAEVAAEEERIDRTLEATEKFFRSLGLSTRLSEEGIGETTIAEIERRFNASGVKYGEAQNVDGAVARRILEACM